MLRFDPDLVQIATALSQNANALLECQKAISNSNKQLKKPSHDVKKQMEQFFVAAQDEISNWFLAISTSRSFVKRVLLVLGEVSDMSLSVKLELINGEYCTPHNVLSEANLDLLALLLFLAVAKEASKRGQAPVLLLDDVLQSVDSAIRVAFAEFFLTEFASWQIIVTVHDRLWFNQLREIFRKSGHSFVEHFLRSWTFQSGFVLNDPGDDIEQSLQTSISSCNLYGMCSYAGLLLESLCHRLSVVLEVSVVRRWEDKYTLADLWPGVNKKLKKTTCRGEAANVDRLVHLRNLIGAHYNEWAQSLSILDAESFAISTIALYRKVRCTHCKTWIEKSGREAWQCRCGAISLRTD